MKTSNKILIIGTSILFLAITASLVASKYGQERVEVNSTATPTWQTLITESFTGISMSMMDCEIIPAKDYKIEILIDPKLVKHFTPKVNNDVLRINIAQGEYQFKDAPKIRVYCPTLSRISASSRTINGEVNAEKLEVSLRSSAQLTLNGKYNLLDLNTTSASSAQFSGNANILKINAASASVVSAKELVTKIADINATSAANISVNATEKLDANASSGSEVIYFGNPKSTNAIATLGASINPGK